MEELPYDQMIVFIGKDSVHNGEFVEFCCVGGFSVQLKSRIVSLKLNTLLK